VALDLGIAAETAGLPAPERPAKAGGESKHDQGAVGTSPSPVAGSKSESRGPQSPTANRPTLLPVPADEVREAAAKPAQDVYRNEYATAKSPVAKRALARRILDDAVKVHDDAVKRYVLCCLARDVAIAGQDERLAIESVDELRRAFAVDAWAMKLDTVGRLANGARPAAARGDLARLALTLAEEAMQADEVSTADELVRLALVEASKAHDRGLVTRAHAAAKKIQELLKVGSAATVARAQLDAHPADAAAHLALGRYLCLAKGDWETGLPHLARGDDAELKALADDDLKHIPLRWRPEAGVRPPAPVPAAAAMKLADRWWDRAEKASGRERECMLVRAGYWYEEVAAGPEAAQYSSTLDLRRRALAKQAIEIPHKTVMVNSLGMPLVLIPAGQFEMGSTPAELAWAEAGGKRDKAIEWYFERVSHEAPQHRVEISKPFYLGMYAVTQAEYEKVMGVNPSAFTARQMPDSAFKTPQPAGYLKLRGVCRQRAVGKDTSRCPVESVGWEDAMEFCHRLSAMPGERLSGPGRREYRLPTEAEWEYACRAGTTTHWYCGDDEGGLADVAWFAGNSEGITHPVGQKRPNAWGLFDMHGNVMQWCADFYGPDYYAQSPHNDPDGPSSAADHVLRGGCRANRAAICRSAFRNHAGPVDHSFDFGLRVVVEVARNESAGTKPAAEAVRPPPAAQAGTGRTRKHGGGPPPAQPSMTAGEAAQVQRQWAQYLGVGVEESNSLGMPLMLIPPGGFQMGAVPEETAWAGEHGEKTPQNQERLASEAPRHPVQITRPFYLAKHLVTQAEFEKLMGVNPSAFAARQIDPSAFPRPLPEGELKIRQVDANKVAGKDTSRHPVETVTWQEAVEFCRRLSALPGERAVKRTYRLPSEAEWEYACRAGTTTRWYPGDDPAGLADASWFKENSGGVTHPVGEKKTNAWGLCDMQGNVRQWCADWFAADWYQQSPASDPVGPPSGTYRVLRGGFCRNDPPAFRSASRFYSTPAARGHAFGFRVVAER
jgi:formylglycine-generating enzyme required for sulfatase activity